MQTSWLLRKVNGPAKAADEDEVQHRRRIVVPAPPGFKAFSVIKSL